MELICGNVIHGQEYGRKIGYRTANLIQEELEIQFGVWATRVLYLDDWYDAISYFSINSKGEKIFESHLFNFEKNIYGECIKVNLVKFLRESIHFDSQELLIDQMKKDCLLTLEILKVHSCGFKSV